MVPWGLTYTPCPTLTPGGGGGGGVGWGGGTHYVRVMGRLHGKDASFFKALGKIVIITPACAARSAALRAYNNRVPILRARARQPRFGSSMQYCIRSLISITNVQKYCKRAKVCASLLLWHFQTIWIENICLPFIEVHRSYKKNYFTLPIEAFPTF